VSLFERIDLADAAAFSVGQHCGVFESVYRKVEWAVLIYWLLKSNLGASIPFHIQSAWTHQLFCSLNFLAKLHAN
jgi:hypothetical protein